MNLMQDKNQLLITPHVMKAPNVGSPSSSHSKPDVGSPPSDHLEPDVRSPLFSHLAPDVG